MSAADDESEEELSKLLHEKGAEWRAIEQDIRDGVRTPLPLRDPHNYTFPTGINSYSPTLEDIEAKEDGSPSTLQDALAAVTELVEAMVQLRDEAVGVGVPEQFMFHIGLNLERSVKLRDQVRNLGLTDHDVADGAPPQIDPMGDLD